MLLSYTTVASDLTRVVVPAHNNLRLRIMYQYHNAPIGYQRGRENTYITVSRDFNFPASIILWAITSVIERFVNG